MKLVAARLRRQRVHQQAAGRQIAGDYLQLSRFKVAARLLVLKAELKVLRGDWKKRTLAKAALA